MRIEQMAVGPIQTNCYFLVEENTKEVLLVDPGAYEQRIVDKIKEEQWKVAGILLTHGHFDHAGKAAAVASHFQGVKIYAHEEEQDVLENPSINLSQGMGGAGEVYHADVYFRGKTSKETIGNFSFTVLHTPGHTKGGCCYWFPQEKVLVSGDTLFQESVGRSDFPTGSAGTLVRSIKEQLMPLEDDTVVLPGHGGRTKIGVERQYNPFL